MRVKLISNCNKWVNQTEFVFDDENDFLQKILILVFEANLLYDRFALFLEMILAYCVADYTSI